MQPAFKELQFLNSCSQNREIANNDDEGISKINETIDLWTKMCLAETNKRERIKEEYKRKQSTCEICVEEIIDCLDRMMQVYQLAAERIRDRCLELLSKVEKFMKEKTEDLVFKIDSMEINLERISMLSGRERMNLSLLLDQNHTFRYRLEMQTIDSVAIDAEARSRAREQSNLIEQLKHQTIEQQEMIDELNQCLRDAKRENEMKSSKMKVKYYQALSW